MSDYQNQLEDRISELQVKLEEAKTDQVRLRDENTHFRALMLTNINGINTLDPIYIAQKKNTWKDLPIEQVLTFLEVFDTHAKIFHEIASEKKGKSALKDHLNSVAKAKVGEADKYREDSKATPINKTKVIGAKNRMKEEFNMTDEQAQIWLMLPKEKRSALRGIMRIVGGHFDAALRMLTAQEEATNANKK